MSGARPHLRLGTRGSALAVAQSEAVVQALSAAHKGLTVAIERIAVPGDGDRPADGRGAPTQELDDALREGKVDLVVHSLRDVPLVVPEELALAAIGPRAHPFDVLITLDERILDDLEEGAKVGAASVRQKAQLLYYNPDLDVIEVRGNLETRWKKLVAGQVEALVLAAADLERLGWQDRVSEILTQDVMVPAVGQGFLAVVTRDDDSTTRSLVEAYEDPKSRIAADCERGFLEEIGGGDVPAGALAAVVENQVVIDGLIASPDGIHVYRGDHQGRKSSAAAIGKRLAIDLLDQGGDRIVARLRAAKG